MLRKKKEDSGGPNWLDTYADMVTLLLTFFVLLFSFSSINQDKWELIVKSFSANGKDPENLVIISDSTPEDGNGKVEEHGDSDELANSQQPPENPDQILNFDDLYKYLKAYVENNKLQDQVSVEKGENFAFITFRENIFFGPNSPVLQDQGKQVLDVLAGAFKNISDDVGAIQFDGHTAKVDDNLDENQSLRDWQLSADRATNVLQYFYTKNVISPGKLSAVGHGEYKPRIPHDGTEATRIKNRRVEIYISKAGSGMLPLEDVYKELDNNKS